MSIAVDDHLLIAAQRGDTVALERVIAQCRPNLRRYASRYCVTTSDAEEAGWASPRSAEQNSNEQEVA